MSRSLLAMALACVGSLALAAEPNQEWTRFRGPNGAGQAPAIDLPSTWTEANYLWRAKLAGVGNSSPVAWGDLIFLTSADPKTGMRHVIALKLADGTLAWQKDYAATTHGLHAQNSYASSTPTVDAEHVYVAWATPEDYTVIALDHQGNEKWRSHLGKFQSRHGYGTSPVLFEDLVICTNDQDGPSSLIALKKSTGDIAWQKPRKVETPQNASYAAPCIYTPEGGPPQLIVNSWAQGISSFNPRTGDLNWEESVFPNRPIGQPIIAGGLILGNSGEGGGNNKVVALRPPTKPNQKPEVVYTIDRSSAPYVPSLVVKDDLLFLWGDAGIISCANVETGEILFRKRLGGNFSSSPICLGDRILNISSDGKATFLAAKPEYEVLGETQLDEGTRATPAVIGGKLYVRTYTQLLCIGPK